ncbi:MAG: hypothetical protein LBC07_00945 [Elusimicrobiota bacterium]|jgi:hypothetical protein|nr:hypothetical protein [Elusimicrobiota bacterium]
MRKIILVFAVNILFSAIAFSTENINAVLSKDKANIGDIVEYRVEVELEPGAYVLAKQNPTFVNADILSFDVTHISADPNIFEIIFKISAYDVGAVQLEPTAIFYLNPDSTLNLFFTPQKSLEITSVLPQGQIALKDIKPLHKFSLRAHHYILFFILFAALFIVIFFIYRDIKKSQEKIVEIDPQTAALDGLKKIKEAGLDKTQPKLFYYAMSEILRGYISYKYKINALEMTTAEFLSEISKILPPEISQNAIKAYLKDFDLMRYADFFVSEEQTQKNFNLTKELVEKL